MSGRKNKRGTVKIICTDIFVAVAVFLLLTLLAAKLVSEERIDGEYTFIVISAALFTAGLCSAIITGIISTDDKCPAALISTVLLLLMPVIFAFAQSENEISAMALVRSTACIAAGRIIPFVIRSNTKHKSKRRAKAIR